MALAPVPFRNVLEQGKGLLAEEWVRWLNALVNAVTDQNSAITALTATVTALSATVSILSTTVDALATWTTLPYAAGDYTASGAMTWGVDSGDQQVRRYARVNTTMLYDFVIATTDVAGVADVELRIALPAGMTVATTANGWLLVNDAGSGFRTGRWVAGAGNAFLSCFRDPGAGAWTLTAGDDTFVAGVATFEVTP